MGRAVKPRKAKKPEPPAPEERGSDATDQPIPRKENTGWLSTAKAPPQAEPLIRDLEGMEGDNPEQARAAMVAGSLSGEDPLDLTGVIPAFRMTASQEETLEMISVWLDGTYYGRATNRITRKQDSGWPDNSYKLALACWKKNREICIQKQDRYNAYMVNWLTEWANKHTRPGTDITKWLKDQMSRKRAKGPPDPLLDKNRPTKGGWQHWVEWGRNYAPPGLPKDDQSEQPSQDEPSQEEQEPSQEEQEPSQEEPTGNRIFRGKSIPGRTAPRAAAAGGGSGGGGGSSGSSSPGDRRGVGRSQSRSSRESVAGTAEPGMPVASVAVPGGASMDELPEGITEADLDEDRRARATAEIVAGCDPAFVAALRKWSIMETHIATLAEGGYTNAADFGMFLDSPGLERLFAKMDKDEDGILNERNRQTLYWFHFWLMEQQRAKVDLETIDLELFTRKVMADLISSTDARNVARGRTSFGTSAGGKGPDAGKVPPFNGLQGTFVA
jgi:hypothetical protein